MTVAGKIAAENPGGGAPVLLVCDHASAHLPAMFGDLGLDARTRCGHAAWDLGAMEMARWVAALLDAPLIGAPVSRLVIDTNRALDARDLIVETADGIGVPGNRGLGRPEREERIREIHVPFHGAIDQFLVSHPNIRAVVSLHSFVPVLAGVRRPWHVGVIYSSQNGDLAAIVAGHFEREPGLVVGRNQPYAPDDGVYYTLDRHANSRGLDSLMLEVRHDLLSSPPGVERWAVRVANALQPTMNLVRA